MSTKNRGCPAIRTVMFPHHINGAGRIFGGVILGQIDIAGGVECRKVTTHRIMTVLFKQVEFKKPVLINDILTCWVDIVRVGRTSITTKIYVEVEREGVTIQVTEGEAIYVAVDKDDQPLTIESGLTAYGKRFLRRQRRADAAAAKATGTANNGGTAPATSEPKTPAATEKKPALNTGSACPASRAVMFPHDINGAGRIFGGVILSHIDIAGAVECRKVCTHRIVTVLFKEVEFKRPVLINDILTCKVDFLRIGRSSISTRIRVEAERDGVTIPVTEGEAIYVAVDKDDKPLAIETALTPFGKTLLRRQRRAEKAAEAAKGGTAPSVPPQAPASTGGGTDADKGKAAKPRRRRQCDTGCKK